MYYQHFGLSGHPFLLTPDPALLYMSSAHREALAALEWGLSEPSGLTLMVGEVGTGKTTLIHSLLLRHHEGVRPVVISQPTLAFEEMLRLILAQLGIKPAAAATRFEMIQALSNSLAALKSSERIALIIDESQALSDATLEELRLLSNLSIGDHAPLQIVLVGQIDLLRRLNTPTLRQLNQRIGARALLLSLNYSEAYGYVEHRLQLKGRSSDEVFTRGALRRIVYHGRGIPRRINVLGHNSMTLAYAAGASRVSAAMAQAAAAEYDDLLKANRPSLALVWQSLARFILRPAASGRRGPRPLQVVLALLAIGAILSPVVSRWNRIDATLAHLKSRAEHELGSSMNDTRRAAAVAEEQLRTASTSLVSGGGDEPQLIANPAPVRAPVSAPQSDQHAAGTAELFAHVAQTASAPGASTAQPAAEDGQSADEPNVVVRPGDTLSGIALTHLGSNRTSLVAKLLEANPQISNADVIHPGQRLNLPSVNQPSVRE